MSSDRCRLGEVHEVMRGTQPFALLDVRSPAAANAGHLPGATALPLDVLEFRAPVLLPRPDLRVIVYDDGDHDGRAQIARDILYTAGYRNVQVLHDGVSAWTAAGESLEQGRNVPSKRFGEMLLAEDPDLLITPEEAQLHIERDGWRVLDVRTPIEHHRECLPASCSSPGFDVIAAAAEEGHRPMLVHCTGRTRSIVAARTLRLLGFPEVRALENGTMGWLLAGYRVLHGANRPAPRAADVGLLTDAARQLAVDAGVGLIDIADAYDLWRERAELPTLYRFDVRTDPMTPPGGIPGFVPVPGGQLVQQLDDHVAVHGAGVLLASEDPLAGLITGYWLRRLGVWPVSVLDGGLPAWRDAGLPWDPVALPIMPLGLPAAAGIAPALTPGAVAERLADGGTTLVSVDPSTVYRRAHLPGAVWYPRSRLRTSAGRWWPERTEPLLLTCADGQRSLLDAAALRRLGYRNVGALSGGVAAWRAAGGKVGSGDEGLPAEPEDVLRHPIDVGPEAMQQYLDWEIALTVNSSGGRAESPR